MNRSDILDKARFWSLMFMTIGLGTFVAMVLQQWAFGKMGQELSRRIRGHLFRCILYQEVGTALRTMHMGSWLGALYARCNNQPDSGRHLATSSIHA